MPRLLENIEKLKYYNKVSKLCYRILKSCTVRENAELEVPARVFSSNKNMFIEINTSFPFFEKDETVQFALMHEALHIAFGHMFLDLSLYDRDKINIAFDASINPYLISYITPSQLAPVLQPEEGKFVSGYSHIYEKNTWEYIYNNFPEENEDIKDGGIDNEENDSSKNGSGDESMDGEHDDTSNKESKDFGCGEENNERRSGSGSNFDKGEITQYSSFDSHEFIEQPSKATQAIMQETVLSAMEELQITAGSELGKHIVTGLSFYQTSKQKWRRLLSKAVLKAIKIKGTESTWLRPSRRFNNTIPIPGKRKLYYPSIGVLVDTSGSMLDYTKDVLNHVITITTETGGIDYLIGGDVKERIYHENVTRKKLHNIKLHGYGGTRLSSMISKLASKPIDIMILITDMYLNDEDIETIQKVSKRKSVILCVPNDPYIENTLKTISRAKIIMVYGEE